MYFRFSLLNIFMDGTSELPRETPSSGGFHVQDNEAGFRALADSMPQLVWTALPDGTVNYYNSRWKEYRGIGQQADGSWLWTSVLHPDDQDPTIRAWTEAVRTGSVYQIEHRVMRADGSYRWHLSRGVPVLDGNGNVARWYGTATDIHESRQAGDELRAAKLEADRRAQELDLALHSIANGVIMYGPGGEILRMNPAAEELFGYTMEERHLPVRERSRLQSAETPDGHELPVEDHPVLRALAGELVRNQSLISRNIRTGRSCHVLVSTAPIRDENRCIIGAIASFNDISRIVELSSERERSERQLRVIFEQAAVGIAVISLEGAFVRMNARRAAIVGYAPEELIGKSLHDLTHPEDRALLDANIAGLLSGSAGSCVMEKREFRKDGSEVWLKVSLSLVRNPGGEPHHFISVIDDISQGKQLETDLLRAKLQAEEANRAKTDFLAQMSHEIRTPISGIIGLSEVLLPKTDGANRDLLLLIRESAQSLLSLIGDVLDLSRIESGKTEISTRPFHLRKELEGVVSPFRPPAEARQLKLLLEVHPDCPDLLRGDLDKLSQVLRNLLSNAIKYTDTGTVTFSVEPEPRGPYTLRFRVKDTGIGIPKDKIPLLFRDFSRIHGQVTRKTQEGTGLGLAISRRLVHLMKGELGVESEPGKGSEFSLSLPLEILDQELLLFDETKRFSLDDLPSLSLLLAEDNEINRVFLQMVLEEAGHKLLIAEDGLQAVDAVNRAAGEGKTFDAILMDIQMPGMDGLEATQVIRSIEGDAGRTPIIALTAFAMKGDEEKFLKKGMNGYVTKPVDFDVLASVISGAIDR